jgi:hypothetical protein
VDGFSVHANVSVRAGDRKRLEEAARYVTRPPIASEQPEALPDGRLSREALVAVADSKGAATGQFVDVQTKSGSSYVTGSAYLFRGDAAHVMHWARCRFPVLGVVFDPQSEIARWVDATSVLKPERLRSGFFTIQIPLGPTTLLEPETLSSLVLPQLLQHHVPRLAATEIADLLQARMDGVVGPREESKRPARERRGLSFWMYFFPRTQAIRRSRTPRIP